MTSHGSQYVMCVENEEYPVSLELRKVYRVIPDATSDKHEFVRVIDESGEDYLFPKSCFAPVEIPVEAFGLFELA